MLVLQQVEVLPKDCEVIIKDGDKRVVDFKKSTEDGSLIFISADDANRYNNVYQTYRVYRLNSFIYNPSITFKNLPDKEYIVYVIQVREGYEEYESKGNSCAST